MSTRSGRPLARQIALLVCSVIVVGTALDVELQWRKEQAEADKERSRNAQEISNRLVTLLGEPHHHSKQPSELIASLVEGAPNLTVELVDGRGVIQWSSREERVGSLLPGASGTSASHLTWLLARGGMNGYEDGRLGFVSMRPLLPPGSHSHENTIMRGRPVGLRLHWDTSAEMAGLDAVHLRRHMSGFTFALAVGFFLWWLLARQVSRPLEGLTKAATRADMLPEDLAPFGERGDEIGALARTLEESRRRLDERESQIAERTIRLSNALNAGDDGIAMAAWMDGTWILEHVNEPLARLLGHPAAWFEGRPISQSLETVRPRLVRAEEVFAWLNRALVEPTFEGVTTCGLCDPESPADDSESAVALLEVTTRPFPDAHGRLSRRLWVVRDVTQARAHESQLRRQNQELAVLDLVARRVSRTLEWKAILVAALDTLREVLDAPFGLVAQTQERRRPLKHLAGDRLRSLASLESWTDALRAGELVVLPDVQAEPDLRVEFLEPVRSLVLLPLSDSTGLVAVMVVGRPAGQPFGIEEVALLRRALHPVNTALENARLFARTQAQLAENQTLSEVSRAIGRGDDLDAALGDILRVVHKRLRYRNAAILLPNEAADELYVRASVGYHESVSELHLPMNGDSVTTTCFLSRVPLNVSDVRDFEGYVAGSDDTRSELSLPLAIGSKVLGILDVESDRVSAFGPDDERLLGAVASQAAMVLHNASLIEEARVRATRLEAVNEIARAVSSTLELSRLDRAIVSQIARVVPGERYAVLRYDHAKRLTHRTVVLDATTDLAHEGDGLAWRFEDGIDPESLTAHHAETLPRLSDAANVAEVREVAHGLASMVMVPIALDGVVAASIVAASAREGGFTTEQIRRLEMVSYHVAVALKNAELFSRLQASYIQLNEAQDSLVRAEKLRALGEMASGVAHDFNNVLGAILARAQLLKRQLAGHEAVAELEVIEKAAQDGASTVRRLQDFTRVRTDRTFEPIAVVQIAEDCLSLTRGRWRDEAERAGIHYDVTTRFDVVPDVEGQASELREVVTNLILNALDAMPDGGALHVSTRLVTDGTGGGTGAQVVLEVKDSGQGMSAEVRARIFDPFFTTKGVRGVGLGLSVAYGIVQRHSGRIEVDSEPGVGTTMRVRLPASGRPSGESHRPAPAAIQKGMRAGVTLAVLVIDDEPSVRSLLGDLLRSAGHEVTQVASGKEGIAWLEAGGQCDIVLTDLGMPDVSGWEVASELRSWEKAPPVVLVTGWGIQLDDQLLVESGVKGVIAKPFTVEEVLDTVERVARLDRPDRSAA